MPDLNNIFYNTWDIWIFEETYELLIMETLYSIIFTMCHFLPSKYYLQENVGWHYNVHMCGVYYRVNCFLVHSMQLFFRPWKCDKNLMCLLIKNLEKNLVNIVKSLRISIKILTYKRRRRIWTRQLRSRTIFFQNFTAIFDEQ